MNWNRPLLLSLWLLALLPLLGCGASPKMSRAYAPGAAMARPQAPMAASPAADERVTVASADEADDEQSEGDQMPEPPPMPAPAMKAGASGGNAGAMRSAEKKMKMADNGARAPVKADSPKRPRNTSDAVTIQQVLIYTADFRMAVFEVDKSMDKLEGLARSLGGFLARRGANQIVIRVPASKFQDAVNGTLKLGDVLDRNIQVEDVTEQMTDLLLRLRNARQVRDRIAQLLAQSRNVKDSLRIERELARISEKIERMEGRLKLLRNKARYSTITVTFQNKGRSSGDTHSKFNLPFPWLSGLGLGRLMNLNY